MRRYVSPFKEDVIAPKNAEQLSDLESVLRDAKIKYTKTEKGFAVESIATAQSAADAANIQTTRLERLAACSLKEESDEESVEERISELEDSLEAKTQELKLAVNKEQKDRVREEIYYFKQQIEDLEDSLLEESKKNSRYKSCF